MEQLKIRTAMDDGELRALAGRYHFDREKLWVIEQVYSMMRPVCIHAYMEMVSREAVFPAGICGGADSTVLKDGTAGSTEDDAPLLACAMTLGMEIDLLQDRLAKMGRLTECYIMDCMAMELLKKSYTAADEYMLHKYRYRVKKMFFPGSGCPMEITSSILGRLHQDQITFNSSYMLTPLKSVVYAAVLTEKESPGGTDPCSGCSRAGCSGKRSLNREFEISGA